MASTIKRPRRKRAVEKMPELIKHEKRDSELNCSKVIKI